MRDFRKLKVWQKAHGLTLDIYRVSLDFPKEELYGLTSQLRRAAASIGANIAEGCGKSTNADMGRFLQIALGSASECEYHPLLARDLALLPQADFERLNQQVTETKMMLTRSIQYLNGRRRSLPDG